MVKVTSLTSIIFASIALVQCAPTTGYGSSMKERRQTLGGLNTLGIDPNFSGIDPDLLGAIAVTHPTDISGKKVKRGALGQLLGGSNNHHGQNTGDHKVTTTGSGTKVPVNGATSNVSGKGNPITDKTGTGTGNANLTPTRGNSDDNDGRGEDKPGDEKDGDRNDGGNEV